MPLKEPKEASLRNLIPANTRSREKFLEISSNGGKKSAEVRRKRKTLKEQLLMLLENGNVQEEIVLSLINKAQAGDIKAFEVVRDTIGEKPKEEVIQIETTYEDYIDRDKKEW